VPLPLEVGKTKFTFAEVELTTEAETKVGAFEITIKPKDFTEKDKQKKMKISFLETERV